MRVLKFIIYLLKHGSRQNSRIDFEGERQVVLKNIAFRFPTLLTSKKKWFITMISKSNLGHLLLVNISYLKSVSRSNRMFFVAENKKLVFVRLLKSASTSMLHELLPFIEPRLGTCNLSDEEIDALSFYYVKNKLSAVESGYSQFCLVRNPFARIVSAYLDLFKVKKESFTYVNYWFGILRYDMSFKEFVTTLSVIPKQWLGPHFSSQYQLLENAGGIQSLVYFRIEKDQIAIANFLHNFSITLPYRNQQKETYDYMTFYDQESFELVYQLYKEDIHVLGYLEDVELLQKSIHISSKPNSMVDSPQS